MSWKTKSQNARNISIDEVNTITSFPYPTFAKTYQVHAGFQFCFVEFQQWILSRYFVRYFELEGYIRFVGS